MDKALALLKSGGLLLQWFDRMIIPGENLSSKLPQQLDQADIIVFLLSPDFIASQACMEEWEYARRLTADGKKVFRVPIILRECSWLHMLRDDDVKALPNDGNPVSTYTDPDKAWMEVYEGIKAVVDEVRSTYTAKDDFLKEMEKTEFISQDHINLQDLFVFLNLTREDPKMEQSARRITISDQETLLAVKHAVIHGQEKAGKSALARHLYLSLVENGQPVLFLDLTQLGNRSHDRWVRESYQAQFQGDYNLWLQQSQKTLILDNLTSAPKSLDFIKYAMDIFDSVVVMVSTDAFYAFFLDEERLSGFQHYKLEPLNSHQQEQLIRKRLSLSTGIEKPITDGFVDEVERRVDSIIISDKIVPRYPFYVLSILQTFEAYMPVNMAITSYGHCYYVLIIASLMRTGISNADHAINACFNFSEQLAFAVYQHRTRSPNEIFDFVNFETEYKTRFLIENAIIGRMKDPTYGIISEYGSFRTQYMYYYFLAKYLASNPTSGKPVVEEMCVHSHRSENFLTLLFTIHHSTDNVIIEDILLRTMCSLDDVHPAELQPAETKRFSTFVGEMPESILSSHSVTQSRKEERDMRPHPDLDDAEPISEANESDQVELVNGTYRILKNNKIMGQVLRNRHSNLERSKVEEIVEIIADSGLRLVNVLLKDDEEITALAVYIKKSKPEWDMPRIKRALETLSFVWTMVNVEQIVESINVPQIKEAVNAVVSRASNPAYDLIGYFSHLDSVGQLTQKDRDILNDLLKKHDDIFVTRVLSIRTQHYMNTHRSRARVEQSVCALLNIKYSPRLAAS